MVSRWLTPLSKNVPGRVRLAKEQLVRRVAAQCCLSSHLVGTHDVEMQQDKTGARGFLDSALSNRLGERASAQRLRSLPTPSPSLMSDSPIDSDTNTAPAVSAHLRRLRHYTAVEMTGNSSHAAPLSKPLATILAHWAPGGDPHQYNWLATSRALEAQAELAAQSQNLSEKELSRLQRREERAAERRKREEENARRFISEGGMRAPDIMSSQNIPSSQATTQASSQHLFSSQIPVSQTNQAINSTSRPPVPEARRPRAARIAGFGPGPALSSPALTRNTASQPQSLAFRGARIPFSGRASQSSSQAQIPASQRDHSDPSSRYPRPSSQIQGGASATQDPTPVQVGSSRASQSQSSQVEASSHGLGMIASQVEPGRYGGRPVSTTMGPPKKKRRTQGF